MFDRWTEKYWKIIRLSEDLTVGIPIQLANKPGLLIEYELQRSNLPMCELFSSAFLSSSQTCIGDEFNVVGSVIELMWLVRWKLTRHFT